MKLVLSSLLAGLLLFLTPINAQDFIEGGLFAEHFQAGYRGQQQIGGILHIGFGERFTLNYQLGLGPALDGGFYAHAPAGFVGGMKIMRAQSVYGNGNFLNYLALGLIILPEGVGCYINDGKLRMHVSVNPLGFDYWYRSDPYFEHGRMSGNVMFRIRMMSSFKWPVYIAPQVGMSMIYRIENSTLDRYGFRAGVTIGLSSDHD